jgi:antitoxin (DNA-binding transcriptional repressor) of toxin-antitoxin stability system
MRSVRLDQLRPELGEYVHLAEAGETIVVTEGDRPVAELVPPRGAVRASRDEDVLARGIREGWIAPATAPRAGPPPSYPCMTFGELMRELDEDRADP